MVDWQVRGDEFPLIKKNFPNVKVLGASFPLGARAGWQKVLVRWVMYVWVSFKALCLSEKYDVITAWQPVCGLFLSLFYRMLGIKPSSLIIQNFIYNQKPSQYYESLRFAFVKLALSKIDYITVFTHAEIGRIAGLFDFPKERIFCIPQGVSPDNNFRPIPIEKTQPYIFAAGMSLRDYGTLIEAVRDISAKVVIVCQKQNLRGLDLPPHVEPHINLWGDKVKELRRNARLVVVPLLEEQVSSGQYDILYAMSEGKAVIATKTVASVEHITDGYDGCLVPCRNAQVLKVKIQNLLDRPEEAARLGNNARKTFLEKFTSDVYQTKMTDLMLKADEHFKKMA